MKSQDEKVGVLRAFRHLHNHVVADDQLGVGFLAHLVPRQPFEIANRPLVHSPAHPRRHHAHVGDVTGRGSDQAPKEACPHGTLVAPAP